MTSGLFIGIKRTIYTDYTNDWAYGIKALNEKRMEIKHDMIPIRNNRENKLVGTR